MEFMAGIESTLAREITPIPTSKRPELRVVENTKAARAAGALAVIEAEQAAIRPYHVPFEEKPSPLGHIIKHRELPIVVERTARNNGLFLYNPELKGFEVAYMKSQDILGMLEMNKASREISPLSNARALAFITTEGVFYDQATFLDLIENEPRGNRKQHTAVFMVEATELRIPIPDMYNLILAVPPENPHTWQSLGGDNN